MPLHRRTSRAIAVSLMAGALAITAQPAQAASFTEGFDDITTLAGAGWQTVNLSSPIGNQTWQQGDGVDSDFTAQSGGPNSYIAVEYRSGSDTATLSNWLIAPKQATLSSTDVLTFWTRTLTYDAGNTVYPDRLEVRMSSNGSCNPGTTPDGVGDFTTLLGSVNPDLTDTGYPQEWTQYSLPLTGLGAANASGCLAFRYFVTDSGPNGDNGNYIGIDTVTFTDNASAACTGAQASATAAQAQVTSATATSASAATSLTKAQATLKKAAKALKKAKKGDNKAKVTKAKKKVKKAKKVVAAARSAVTEAATGLTTAQTALSTAQGTVTSSCP